jgi:hypothetical protein
MFTMFERKWQNAVVELRKLIEFSGYLLRFEPDTSITGYRNLLLFENHILTARKVSAVCSNTSCTGPL